ncbi:MAG: SDR family NAD(P)-dependent oxidoreductase, partial [Gammaproteobacteria bacterium]
MNTGQTTLDNQWVLITGAAKRIGGCSAELLHEHGANIAIHYRGSAELAEALASKLNGVRAESAFTVQADLLDTASLPELIATVVTRAGRLDALINNASTFYPTPVGSITEENWNDLIGANLKAPVFLSQAATPHLIESSGCIVNIIDIHATRPLKNHTVYGPAKAGLAM